MKKIAVAMSGGVDSAVAAYLLRQKGWEVLGVFMKNWQDELVQPAYRTEGQGCTQEEDFVMMREVCRHLGISYVVFNFVKEYKHKVFNYFVRELRRGYTPNPDVLCNQEVKFKLFAQRALQLPNISQIATGHYAKINRGQLCRPRDRAKDQTYFLYRIAPKLLPKIIFPLQDLTKVQVRRLAHRVGLPNAAKKDSTGICFVGEINHREFVRAYISDRPGDIVNTRREKIGRHFGLHLFTIGQRQGLNIGGTGPYYVVAKNSKTNTLLVTNHDQDPYLFGSQCVVSNLHWLNPHYPQTLLSKKIDVQIRYRQPVQSAHLKLLGKNGSKLQIIFSRPQRAITPGQSAVIYYHDVVCGGGVIGET